MYNHVEEGAFMSLLRQDSRKLHILFLGYILLAFGIYLTKLSTLGMSSWSVFHDGLSIVTGMSFGLVTQLLGLIILALSIAFLKTKVGIGTIFNVLFVGIFIDLFELAFSDLPEILTYQVVVLIFGVVFTTMGRSLYIASKLGPGPRDGLFVGLSRITRIDVKYVKPFIEFIILGIGILLGGQSGLGTVLIILVSGYMVQFFFKVFGFDPKSKKQSDIMQYGDRVMYSLIVLLFIGIGFNIYLSSVL